MAEITPEYAAEQAALCWRAFNAYRRHPEWHVHAPFMELQARAWDRIADGKPETRIEGGGNDAA